MSFGIEPFTHSTCCRWILYCKFSSTARSCFHFKVASHSSQLAWRKDCSFSAVRFEVCFSTSLLLPRAYWRASARPAVCWACRLSWPDFLPRTPYCIDFSIQHSSRISLSTSFSLQHSLSPCDRFLCHLIDSLVRQRRKHSIFPWKISKSANALFRFSTTSGWLLPETTLSFFPSCTGKTHSSLVNFSPSQHHHYCSFNDTSCTSPCNLDALPLFSPFCLTFFFRMTVPEPNEFRQLDTFPHLCNCTPKLPPQRPHPAPLAFHRVAHPWLFLHCQLLNTLFASLIVLFLPFSVSVVLCLLIYCIFLHVSSRETIHTNFFRGGHSYTADLPFRITTCRFLLAIVFRTWGLVCINLSFASREFVCARSTTFAHDLDSHCIRFCPLA